MGPVVGDGEMTGLKETSRSAFKLWFRTTKQVDLDFHAVGTWGNMGHYDIIVLMRLGYYDSSV